MATKRFGRNISNVQLSNIQNKQHIIKKTTKPTKKTIYPTSKTSSKTISKSFNDKRQIKSSNSSKSLFDKVQKHQQTSSSSIKNQILSPSTDPMCIDDLNDENNNIIEHEDIDQYDTHDPQFASEYINDIMKFLKEKELTMRINPNYCSKQKDIKYRHRNQLIRWMAEVYVQLKLFSETFVLSVSIVDQILSLCLVSRKKLHLIGVASLFIASKYEETWAPPLNDFRICCDFAFSEDEIIAMEREILNRIDFNLCIPAPIYFLRRYSKAGHSDPKTHTIAKFFIEMICQSYTMLKFLPSQIAAASVLLARQIRGGCDSLWNDNLRFYSGYEKDDLIECGQTLTAFIYKELSSQQPGAIIKKYSDKKMLEVAILVSRVFQSA